MASAAGIYPDSTNLKLTELLTEVKLDYSPSNTKIIDDVVSSIREAIDKIQDGIQVTADVAPGFVRDVGADKVDFKFRRPKSVEIGGSYSFQCVARPDVNVDLFLRLPKECFHEKDYLNHRYHAKRFLYLCIIKKHLKLSPLIQDVKWSTIQNEARKPVLVVFPAAKLSNNYVFSLKIIPTAPSLFTVSKLKCERNNVRSISKEATPKYNSSILEDMFMEDNANFIKRTFMGHKELREALLLLKIWARKRSLFVHDCLSGFLITAIMAYLASGSGKNRITSSMIPIQILRITLDFIANSKVWANGLLFQLEDGRHISNKDRKAQLQPFPIIMCDSFADYNMAFRISPTGFQELRDEAALALNCMDKCKDNGFDEIFMTKIDCPAKYDYCIRLNLKDNHDFHASGFCLDDECWRSYEQKVLSIIDQALRGRTKIVRAIWKNTASECNFEDGFSMLDGESVFIGITIGSMEEAYKRLIMGPSTEDEAKAAEFRQFWGDKAEQRQFKNQVVYVAVWEHSGWDKHLIIKGISEHVLTRHLSLQKQNITSIVDQLDFALQHGNTDPVSFAENLLKAYDNLSNKLRELDDIPLKISSVKPLDSAFRLTSVFPPIPHPLANVEGMKIKLQNLTASCIQPLEVMIELEGSGNWPLDEHAMEKTKSAFLLKIAESLHNKYGAVPTATEDAVDIFMSGYAFRLKILHERGLGLVRRHGGAPVKRILSSDKRLFLRSQHSSMIKGLQGRHPIYGPVVRLAKRWVTAHLFSNSLTEEAIELLVAHLFLKPWPFSPPCSRITGFLRFLRLLSGYNWSFSPLVVDINDELTPDDDKEINENFTKSRKDYEENMVNISPAMFVATVYDKASEAWTGQSPTSAELKRLVAYANSSADLLAKTIMENQINSYGWECLFRTPLNNYNAVILLHRDKLPYPQRLLFPSEVNQGRHLIHGKASKTFQPFFLTENMKGDLEELKNKLMVNFDPLRNFVADMENEFPHMFKVWYDSLGGDAIGLTCGNKNSKKRGRVEGGEDIDLVNALKIVGELGQGLVKSVHLLKAPKLN